MKNKHQAGKGGSTNGGAKQVPIQFVTGEGVEVTPAAGVTATPISGVVFGEKPPLKKARSPKNYGYVQLRFQREEMERYKKMVPGGGIRRALYRLLDLGAAGVNGPVEIVHSNKGRGCTWVAVQMTRTELNMYKRMAAEHGTRVDKYLAHLAALGCDRTEMSPSGYTEMLVSIHPEVERALRYIAKARCGSLGHVNSAEMASALLMHVTANLKAFCKLMDNFAAYRDAEGFSEKGQGFALLASRMTAQVNAAENAA